jgi:hypothetical protein
LATLRESRGYCGALGYNKDYLFYVEVADPLQSKKLVRISKKPVSDAGAEIIPLADADVIDALDILADETTVFRSSDRDVYSAAVDGTSGERMSVTGGRMATRLAADGHSRLLHERQGVELPEVGMS